MSKHHNCRQFDVPSSVVELFAKLPPTTAQLEVMALSDDKYTIPPFLRKTPMDPVESAQAVVAAIDKRIAWLAERGMRPHQNVLDRREHYLRRLTDLGEK